MPLFPTKPLIHVVEQGPLNVMDSAADHKDEEARKHRIRVKNRRKRYLDLHPEYFGPALEIADPLLYDRLIRKYQTAAERQEEGRQKGFSGILQADIMRGEAKIDAIHRAAAEGNSSLRYVQKPSGEIVVEDMEDPPRDKAEAKERWRYEMQMRFLRGEDDDFDYKAVDENEEWDDVVEENRDREDAYFEKEEPSWELEDGQKPKGETGVQDY